MCQSVIAFHDIKAPIFILLQMDRHGGNWEIANAGHKICTRKIKYSQNHIIVTPSIKEAKDNTTCLSLEGLEN